MIQIVRCELVSIAKQCFQFWNFVRGHKLNKRFCWDWIIDVYHSWILFPIKNELKGKIAKYREKTFTKHFEFLVTFGLQRTIDLIKAKVLWILRFLPLEPLNQNIYRNTPFLTLLNRNQLKFVSSTEWISTMAHPSIWYGWTKNEKFSHKTNLNGKLLMFTCNFISSNVMKSHWLVLFLLRTLLLPKFLLLKLVRSYIWLTELDFNNLIYKCFSKFVHHRKISTEKNCACVVHIDPSLFTFINQSIVIHFEIHSIVTYKSFLNYSKKYSMKDPQIG